MDFEERSRAEDENKEGRFNLRVSALPAKSGFLVSARVLLLAELPKAVYPSYLQSRRAIA